MNHNSSIFRFILAMIITSGPVYTAHADDDDYLDHIEARHLMNAGEILPLEAILENVRRRVPGKVIEVELEKENQEIVYEVEILSNGVIREVYINARTGKLLLIKEDD